jgi:hypothetical protein
LDDGVQAGLIVVGFLALGTLYFIGYVFFFTLKMIFVGLPQAFESSRIDCTKNYRLPNGSKSRNNIHRRDDYWNDAGDGSGVNYVVMPNGEVRID